MSETIQSISNGTYTIGETSATNFIAGPGITITQPSEGTVRIANDETVLWSGAYDNNGFTTTEKCGNFEYLIVTFSRGNSMSYTNLIKGSDSLISYGGALYDIDEGAHFQEVVAAVSSNNGTVWNTVGYQRRWNVSTTAVGGNTGTNMNYITKIVGINRKEV